MESVECGDWKKRKYVYTTNSGSASIADYTRGSLTQLCGSSTFLGVVESAGSYQGKKARKAVSTRGGGVGSSSRGVSVKGVVAHAPPGPAADFPSGSSRRVFFIFLFFSSPRKSSMKIMRESTRNLARILDPVPNFAYPSSSTKQIPYYLCKCDGTSLSPSLSFFLSPRDT